MSVEYVKPFLKWAGNKFRVLPRIERALPPGDLPYTAYAEPFLGAGSVFMNLMRDYHPLFLNDFNQDIIRVYRALQTDPDGLIETTRSMFADGNEEDVYYERRDIFNARDVSNLEQAALFLYLNRHGFNGLCRYNRDGGFNVPYGRYKSPYFPESELRAVAEMTGHLNGAFSTGDFGDVFRQVMDSPEGADRFVIYCDPPYAPLDQASNFTSYAAGEFGWDEQKRLAEDARAAAEAGAWVILSNHSTPTVRELYEGAGIIEFDVRRSISASGDKRGSAPELLAIFAPKAHQAAVDGILADEERRQLELEGQLDLFEAAG